MATKMKPSGIEWIGEIPYAWGCEKLKYHATINPTTDLKAIEFDDDTEVSFVPMEYLHNGFHDYSSIAFSQVKRGYTVFSEGDILLAKVTPCFENGNIAIAEDLIKGVGFGSTEILTIRCNGINPSFTYYCLQNPTFKARAVAEMYGVAGLKRIPPTFIENSFFSFPSSSTQQHIADYLDQKCSDIDKIILAKQRQNELLKEQRQSIIYEAVTKGLDKQVKYKDSGIEWIGEIPEGWEVVRLKFLCETIKTGTTPSTRAKQYFNGTLNWFTPGDFSDKLELVDSGRKLDYSAVVDNEVPIFPAGTIMIIGIGATMGRVGFMLEEGSCNQQLTGLVVKAGIYSRELLYWLYAMSYYVRNMANFTTLPILNNQVLCNISCIVPPIDVQQHIADYLDQKCADIDRIINANNDMIEKLKEYRQSIVYEAVTGKIDI